MKAVTVRQPWATLIAVGAKRVETRSWATRHRGVLAVRAAKAFPGEARRLCWYKPLYSPLSDAGCVRINYRYQAVPEKEVCLPLGAIVAVVELVACWRLTESAIYSVPCDVTRWGREYWSVDISRDELAFGDYAPGRYGWVLAEVRRLEKPIPCRGQQGLWTVPGEIETETWRQLGRRAL